MSTKSPKTSQSKEPMRAVDPQPMRSRSPSPVRANTYPAPGKPESKAQPDPRQDSYSQMRYNPQDYASGGYNPQNYNPQDYNPQEWRPHTYTPQNYTPGAHNYDPKAYTTQSYNPQDYPPVSAAGAPNGPGVSATGIPLRPASNPQAPQEYARPEEKGNKMPGGMTETIRPGSQLAPIVAAPTSLRDLRSLKTNCQLELREYLNLQRQLRSGNSGMNPYELEGRMRDQSWLVISNLKTLHDEVRGIAKEAENHRWRRWIIGGAIATFIPFIRRFFRRNHDEESQTSSNDTEYAFRRSKGLLDHIKDNVFGSGHLAKLAFLVFAVLYVFSNEVSIRVAKTVQKRLKKLTKRIGEGDPDVDDRDMKLLEGWRWRVLLW